MKRAFDFRVRSAVRCELIPISETVIRAVAESGVRDGICLVSVPHTTAGVLINENADPDVASDILARLERLSPHDPGYRHVEGNSDAHIKAVLVGSSVSVPIRNSILALGTWQGIFFAEFDGPRTRGFLVDIIART